MKCLIKQTNILFTQYHKTWSMLRDNINMKIDWNENALVKVHREWNFVWFVSIIQFLCVNLMFFFFQQNPFINLHHMLLFDSWKTIAISLWFEIYSQYHYLYATSLLQQLLFLMFFFKFLYLFTFKRKISISYRYILTLQLYKKKNFWKFFLLFNL